MKRFDNLWEEFLTLDNFLRAYKKVNRGKNKRNIESVLFSENLTANLLKLMASLENGSYIPDKYTEFYVHEPKIRLILAPSFKDKIVQIALYTTLKKIYFPCFLNSSFAAIDNMGVHKCQDAIQSMMRKAKRNMTSPQIVKLDIKKFFYSIDRGILKNLFRKKIKDKRILNLLDITTDSASQMGPLGLPLGNTISQLSANIYLNEIDNYIKKELGIKYYVRYMDDMILLVDSKDRAREMIENLRKRIGAKLNLKLNEKKTKFFPLSQGTNTAGYIIRTTHKLLRSRSKKTLKRLLKNILENKNGLMSWLTHLIRANAYNFFIKNFA